MCFQRPGTHHQTIIQRRTRIIDPAIIAAMTVDTERNWGWTCREAEIGALPSRAPGRKLKLPDEAGQQVPRFK